MKNYTIIEITLRNGHSIVLSSEKGEWDDYAYDGTVFVVKKDGVWVGIYNIADIFSVVVK